MRVRSRQRAATAAAVVTALAGLASLACDKEHTCRPGTVFLHVTTGPFITANRVDVDVYINGVGPEHTELAFAAGTRGGGVEVQFPKGYPEGLMVRIDLTLKANGATIAAHREDFTPRGECEAIDVVFVPSDGLTGAGGTGGATGGAGGSAGSAGSAGTSGAAGSGGAVGSGGNVAGRGGAGGTAGAAGSGGAGGVAGTGGTAGRGGTGGVAGTGGAAGRGGTGGVAGTGGAAGRGGTGGGAGRGGTGGAPCVPTAEFCYNGADDDCDGRIDCEDSDCTPIAACVPLDAGGARIGVMLAATATCPTNYTDMTALNQNLSGGACAGCSCRPPTLTSCSATISSFATAADCGNTSNAGTLEATLSSTQTCTTPDWVGSSFGTIYGVQAGPFTPTLSGSCVPQGTATPGTASWATSGRFCAATMVGFGCATGQACAPIATPPKCVMWEGLHTCQAGSTTTYWYTGFTDSRTCGTCTCGGPTGQSCAGMRIVVGTDHTCTTATATVASGARSCYPATQGVYSPGLIFTGTATQPTCPGSATTGGTLTATGIKTLCCL